MGQDKHALGWGFTTTGLEKKQTAFFTVNVVARKKEKNKPDTNPYMKKFLEISLYIMGLYILIEQIQTHWHNPRLI